MANPAPLDQNLVRSAATAAAAALQELNTQPGTREGRQTHKLTFPLPTKFKGEHDDEETFLNFIYQLKSYLTLNDRRFGVALKAIEDEILPDITDDNMMTLLNRDERLSCDAFHLQQLSSDLLNILMLLLEGRAFVFHTSSQPPIDLVLIRN